MGIQVRPDELHRHRRVLHQHPFRHDVARFAHRGRQGPRVHARDLVAEDHRAVTDVAGEDRLDVVEGHIEVHQLQGRCQSADGAVVPHPDRQLDLDGRHTPAVQRHGGTVRCYPGVGQIAHDGVGQSEVLLNGRRVEADLPPHRYGARGQCGVPPGQHGAHATRYGGGCVLFGVLVGHPASLAPAAGRDLQVARRVGLSCAPATCAAAICATATATCGVAAAVAPSAPASAEGTTTAEAAHRRRGRVLRPGAPGAAAPGRPGRRRTEGSSGRATWWNGLPRGAGSPRSRGYARRGRIPGQASRRRQPPRLELGCRRAWGQPITG